MWNLKKMLQMNLFTKQKQMHRHREQAKGYQSERGLGINYEFELNRYILQYIKQINNNDLLLNIWHRELYSVSYNNHNGK